MAGFGDEREGVRAEAEEKCRGDIEEREREGKFEDALHGTVRFGVGMHTVSIVVAVGGRRVSTALRQENTGRMAGFYGRLTEHG